MQLLFADGPIAEVAGVMKDCVECCIIEEACVEPAEFVGLHIRYGPDTENVILADHWHGLSQPCALVAWTPEDGFTVDAVNRAGAVRRAGRKIADLGRLSSGPSRSTGNRSSGGMEPTPLTCRFIPETSGKGGVIMRGWGISLPFLSSHAFWLLVAESPSTTLGGIHWRTCRVP